MNTQLIAYDRIPDVPSFVKEIGTSIAKSKLFGCESEEQGHVIALECIARRLPPLSIAERYHLIHGKLSKKSEAMLAEFREVAKGSHKVIRRDAECVEIELVTADRQSQIFKLTWDEARKEPFVYEGKEQTIVDQLASGNADKLKLKPKYATPRSRMQMLWSRLVSDSIRCVAPEIVCGTYTPEEVSDFDSMPADVQNGHIPEATVVVDGTETIVDVEPVETSNLATVEQMKEIYVLYTTLEVSAEKQLEILANRNCESVREFTKDQATELLNSLRSILAKRASKQQPESTSQPAGTSQQPSEPSEIDINGPCMEHQVADIKELMKQLAQKAIPDITARVKKKLAQHGLKVLADLTHQEAINFQKALEAKSVEAFFEADLRGHCPKPDSEQSKESDAKNSTGEQS